MSSDLRLEQDGTRLTRGTNTELRIVSTIDCPDDHRAPGPHDDVAWRDLELHDIPQLASFAPEEWGIALDAALLQHVGRSYFHARVASIGSRIVAVGQGIATGRNGWIGNIIVQPDVRNRGFGSRMTQVVMAELHSRGCSSMLLVATPMGEPVYTRLGFRRASEYVFLDVPRLPPPRTSAIRRLNPADLNDVLGMDARVSGETRAELLDPHLASGWVHADPGSRIDGVFLPTFGAGLVLGEATSAGLDLLRFKHAYFSRQAVVPAANAAAVQFLVAHGARETARAPRMALGEEADWRPECVFARAAGFCG